MVAAKSISLRRITNGFVKRTGLRACHWSLTSRTLPRNAFWSFIPDASRCSASGISNSAGFQNNLSHQLRGGTPMGMYSSFSSRTQAADDIRIAMQSLSG